jgi:hypothetical protein
LDGASFAVAGNFKISARNADALRRGRPAVRAGNIYDYTNDYVREANSVWMQAELQRALREDFPPYNWVFVGHNHRAFLGTELGFLYPHDDTESPMAVFNLAGQRAYISIGSVGQPPRRRSARLMGVARRSNGHLPPVGIRLAQNREIDYGRKSARVSRPPP